MISEFATPHCVLILGRIPFATIRSADSGAKHFLNALTAMFREELREPHPGIQISLASPGVVRTDFGLTYTRYQARASGSPRIARRSAATRRT